MSKEDDLFFALIGRMLFNKVALDYQTAKHFQASKSSRLSISSTKELDYRRNPFLYNDSSAAIRDFIDEATKSIVNLLV